MAIRERLNEHRSVVGAVAGFLVVAALAFGLREGCSSPASEVEGAAERAFFTVDDGKSWFAADASNIPPFQHEGKTAYGVKIYRCPDGTAFASHLERYNETDKKRLEALTATGPPKGPGAVMDRMAFTRAAEVKRPGDKQWIKWTPQSSEQYERTIQPTCPDGSTSNMQPVLPPD